MAEPKASTAKFKDRDVVTVVAAATSAAAKLALHATGRHQLSRHEAALLSDQLLALLEVIDASLPE